MKREYLAAWSISPKEDERIVCEDSFAEAVHEGRLGRISSYCGRINTISIEINASFCSKLGYDETLFGSLRKHLKEGSGSEVMILRAEIKNGGGLDLLKKINPAFTFIDPYGFNPTPNIVCSQQTS